MTQELQAIVERGEPSPRFGIGTAEEFELRVSDRKHHELILAGNRAAMPKAQELVEQACIAPILAQQLIDIGKLCDEFKDITNDNVNFKVFRDRLERIREGQ